MIRRTASSQRAALSCDVRGGKESCPDRCRRGYCRADAAVRKREASGIGSQRSGPAGSRAAHATPAARHPPKSNNTARYPGQAGGLRPKMRSPTVHSWRYPLTPAAAAGMDGELSARVMLSAHIESAQGVPRGLPGGTMRGQAGFERGLAQLHQDAAERRAARPGGRALAPSVPERGRGPPSHFDGSMPTEQLSEARDRRWAS